MQTVRNACQPQPHALSIKLSDQIEHLDELITAEGDGTQFFEKTYITQGMQDLISEGMARLAGVSTQGVFHLKQAMGGGKTHLLVGFGLLAKHPALRKQYCGSIPHAQAFGVADIAAFNGRNNPDHFFWGEIANQLGKGEQFKAFWTSGPKAPDEKDWLKLFDGGTPILILLDEMPPYFHYLDTQKVGNGTVADIATRAFANLITATGKKRNVCVVVSDLAASYDTGTRLINRALEDARAELGRQERHITPVDLAANEIYDILRKRLFTSLPDKAAISDIAASYGRKPEEASKSKVANRGAEAIADEIAATYPFHPRLKNVVALFKENEQFKQTRGLIELVSRLLRSVWERQANDVFLIGPQHFDLGIQEVRDKLTEISGRRDVIAKDLWDSNASAHAQVIDLKTGKAAATQVGSLLLTASLSTAVNAVKGLTREEMVECLVSPLREPSEFLAAFEEREKSAWYLHHTPEGRYSFDRQENLTKLLQSLAHDAPEPHVDDLIRHRLTAIFKLTRKTAYDDVLPLPRIEDVADRVRRGRVLLIVSPDAKIPPEEVQKFEGLSQKNNLCVLTGDKTAMGSVENAARQLYAAQKADSRIPKGHPQRDELEKKQQTYEQDLNATILNLFDKVLFSIQRAGRPSQLASKALDMTRDTNKPFDGEAQIEKTLTSNPLKLYLDVEKDFDPIRDKAQDLLWPENQDEARWSDVADRYTEQAGMPWLPPKGLDMLKSIACNRGLWEDLGNGYVTKKPKKKKTSVQVIAESEPNDDGNVRLRINAQNAGPAPRIYYAEDGPISESSPQLTDQHLTTKALRMSFLVMDPSGQYETGDVVTWSNKLVLRNRLTEKDGKRTVELLAAPTGEIHYTLDGSEPRASILYDKPVDIGDGEVLLRAFAEASGLETKVEFRVRDHQMSPSVTPFSLKDAPALIERLLPIQKLSAEAYKEQMAGSGKTLTALGSYWKGRKPLILNKACILGCLLPATDDPARDLKIFEKLMAMDDESFVARWRRRPRPKEILATLSIARIADYFIVEPEGALPASAPVDWSKPEYATVKVVWRADCSELERRRLEAQMLPNAPYRERVDQAQRPEEVMDTVHDHIWDAVNDYLMRSGAPEKQMAAASQGTVRTDGSGQDPYLIHTVDGIEYRTKISTLRGDYRKDDGSNGNRLRLWEKHDFKPRPDDIFLERLYCVQWMRPKKKGKGDDYESRAVTSEDVKRERIVEDFIAKHLADWQAKGWVLDMRIEPGAETTRLFRERGWTHWHHLWNARHLLSLGLIKQSLTDAGLCVLFTGIVDFSSRLSRWETTGARVAKDGSGKQGGGASNNTKNIFYNQALNTLYNYGCRSLADLFAVIKKDISRYKLSRATRVECTSALDLTIDNDVYVADPPYGDAIKYEEILDFFIAWLRKNPPSEFADWVWDSRRSLAIKGEDESFRHSMVAAYKRMTECMPDNGIQVIMFTHQNGSIWGDMANIVWASGLQVTAAWYVVTETDSALRAGSHVKGTVLLVCRKRQGSLKTTRDDLAWEIQEEVEAQVQALTGLNQEARGLYRDENVFEDADLQMAGYAAALRVLTRYAIIDGRDMTTEAIRPRVRGEIAFVDGHEVLAHLTLNVPDYYANQTQRNLVVELADYLARKLETSRPDEASAARILRELVKHQRLG